MGGETFPLTPEYPTVCVFNFKSLSSASKSPTPPDFYKVNSILLCIVKAEGILICIPFVLSTRKLCLCCLYMVNYTKSLEAITVMQARDLIANRPKKHYAHYDSVHANFKRMNRDARNFIVNTFNR